MKEGDLRFGERVSQRTRRRAMLEKADFFHDLFSHLPSHSAHRDFQTEISAWA